MRPSTFDLLFALVTGIVTGVAVVLWIASASCGPTCMETEDRPVWGGSQGPSSSGACGPQATPLTTGTTEAL